MPTSSYWVPSSPGSQLLHRGYNNRLWREEIGLKTQRLLNRRMHWNSWLSSRVMFKHIMWTAYHSAASIALVKLASEIPSTATATLWEDLPATPELICTKTISFSKQRRSKRWCGSKTTAHLLISLTGRSLTKTVRFLISSYEKRHQWGRLIYQHSTELRRVKHLPRTRVIPFRQCRICANRMTVFLWLSNQRGYQSQPRIRDRWHKAACSQKIEIKACYLSWTRTRSGTFAPPRVYRPSTLSYRRWETSVSFRHIELAGCSPHLMIQGVVPCQTRHYTIITGICEIGIDRCELKSCKKKRSHGTWTRFWILRTRSSS